MNSTRSIVFDLSVPEKLKLVEEIWDNIAEEAEAIPVHDWQKKELNRRKTKLKNNPDTGLSWEDIKLRVRSRNEH